MPLGAEQVVLGRVGHHRATAHGHALAKLGSQCVLQWHGMIPYETASLRASVALGIVAILLAKFDGSVGA